MTNPNFPDPNNPNLFDGSYNQVYGPYVQPFTGLDTTDIQPDTQNLQFWFLGTKNAYYEWIGEQDGQNGAGPFSVQQGDEQYQSNYNTGWAAGNYYRTMTGANNVSL